MNEYRLSVVVPVYNVEKYLKHLLDDLLNQTLPFFEIIAIDDASPDESAEIIDRYCREYPQIKPVHLKENGGLSNARNVGLSKVTGDYVLFIDADDRVDRKLNERLCNCLSAHNADVTLFGLREDYYTKNGSIGKSVDILPTLNGYFSGKDEILPLVPVLEEQTLFGYAWNKLYNVEFLKKNALLFEQIKLIEDVCFNIEVFSKATSVNIISEILYFYRKNEVSESLTGKFIPEYFALTYKRISLLYGLLSETGAKNNKAEDILGTLLTRYVFSALSRNCDKRSGLKRKQMRKFLTDFYEDVLFEKLIKKANGKGKLSAVLCRILKNKQTTLCLFAGRCIYIVKTKLPLLFAGLKQ